MERISKIITELLRTALRFIERWSTERTLIEWYENECKKDSLVIFYISHRVDSEIYLYCEQKIIKGSPDILETLQEVRDRAGTSGIDSGYIVVENKLIKQVIEQHLELEFE